MQSPMLDVAWAAGVTDVATPVPAPPGRRETVVATASAMMEALRADDLDLAERELGTLAELTDRPLDHPDLAIFSVLIAIQRGQARAALQYLNELGEDRYPELRVLCLYSLQDPYWEGLARELAESAPAPARAAMEKMLACRAAIPAGRK